MLSPRISGYHRRYSIAVLATLLSYAGLASRLCSVSLPDWAELHGVPANQRGALDMPAGDGVTNLLKYALGVLPMEHAAARLPQLQVIEQGAGSSALALVFTPNPQAEGIRYALETSENLVAWTEVTSVREPHGDNSSGTGLVRLRELEPKVAAARFARLRVDMLNVFTIPFPANGQLYIPDVQTSYPGVDWTKLDRLYLTAGHYAYIRLGNLPLRSAARPLVINNRGGQVRVGGLGHHYLFSLTGGSNWALTGKYDAAQGLGDAAFPGHQGNNYANTRGRYGILVDDAFYKNEIIGISVGGRATRFEISHIELCRLGFAGLSLKTDNDGTALMSDVRLHDLYIHDVGGEGFYIGSTQAPPQHALEGLTIYNCRVLRTGYEALQAGQLGDRNEIHHNVFGPAALDWKDAFQTYQDNGAQGNCRYGKTSIHHNIFIGGADSLFSFFDVKRAADTRRPGDGLMFSDNYCSSYRQLGAYLGSTGGEGEDGVTSYRYERNYLRGFKWQRFEVYPTATKPQHLFRTFLNLSAVTLLDNKFDSELNLTNRIAGINGVSGNVTATGNERVPLPPVVYNDAGFPANFDYLRLEIWAAASALNNNTPITYEMDDWVMHKGVPYRCIQGGANAGLRPDLQPETWEPQPLPADDVRLHPGSPYNGIGLLDQAD
jgi:hypothetical protein